jgi:DNA-binding NarL/FixJ family response regulator
LGGGKRKRGGGRFPGTTAGPGHPRFEPQALRRVADGRTYVEREIAEELVFSDIRASPHPLDALASRDLEILRLLAQGRNLVQIADALGISYKTAANNCSQIKAKLRAGSTADLIRIAVQHGLAEGDVPRP